MAGKNDTNNAASGEEYQVPTAELRQNEYPFRESHPGYKFSHFKQRKHEVIPMLSLPEGNIYRIEELEVSYATPSSIAVKKREDCEKSVLVMFRPYCFLADLQYSESDGSDIYWTKLIHEIKEEGKFWRTGFDMLHHMEDR